MSFDLVVFEPYAAPTSNSEEFLSWYDEQTKWTEDHDYDDPAVCSETLRLWLSDLTPEFPGMNGPLASGLDEDHPILADYCIGKNIIYVSFSWSSADAALNRVYLLAKKHRLGFFDVSAESGGVWLPTKNGGYEMVLSADDLDTAEEGYGLFVFDPEQAPNDQEPFINWCIQLQDQLREQFELKVEAEIDPTLQPWFNEIINHFPYMQELGNSDTQSRVTDYCFFGPAIFAVFPEALSVEANETVLKLAKSHALGVHEIGGNGDVWLPTADGGYEVAFCVTVTEE